MKATDIKDLFLSPENNKEVKIEGWIRTIRDLKNFGFIEVNDGTCLKNVQVVFEKDLSNFEEVKKFSTGSAISVIGNLVLTPQAKQPFEIRAGQISLEAPSDPAYPLQKKRHTMEYLRTIAHLRPRTNTFSAVFRVRSIAAYAIHKSITGGVRVILVPFLLISITGGDSISGTGSTSVLFGQNM